MIRFCEKKIFNLPLVLCASIVMTSCTAMQTVPASDAVLDYYEEGYNSRNWKTRVDALQSIASVRGERADSLIVKGLEDSHNAVKIAALQILSDRVVKKAHVPIKELALKSENSNIRWNAVKALSRYRDPRDASVFIYNFGHDDWLIREAAIVGLLGIDDYSTKYVHGNVIVKALDDPSISVKLAALSNLTVKHPLIYSSLIKMINNENLKKPTLLAEVVKALQMYSIEEKDRDIIINLLSHDSVHVRIAALNTLRAQQERK